MPTHEDEVSILTPNFFRTTDNPTDLDILSLCSPGNDSYVACVARYYPVLSPAFVSEAK
jgi:hypothetical protein